MGIEQGDIVLVLVPVPFTDLSSQKRRPVIVISNDNYNRQSADILVVAMTSNPAQVSYSFILTSSDLVKGSLNRPSTVRIDKIYTLAQAIIVNKFGKVSPEIVNQIRQVLDALTLPGSSTSTR